MHYKSLFKNCTLWLIALSISACVTTDSPMSFIDQAKAPNPYPEPATVYLQQGNQLSAAGRLIHDGLYARAKQLLKNTPKSPERFLLQAQLDHQTQHPKHALQKLSLINLPEALSTEQQSDYYELLTQIYTQQNKIVLALEQTQKRQALLRTPAQQQQNLNQTWALLQKFNDEQLTELLTSTDDPTLRGWYQLALLTSPQGIKQWQVSYPNHPAQQLLKGQFIRANQQAKRIAVLLPLEGPLASPAKAIRDGIMTAYFDSSQKNQIHLTVYDTSKDTISTVYKQLMENQSDLIVGPLNKTKVKQLAEIDPAIPTISLNYNNTINAPSEFYQFGLQAQKQASQTAQRAWQQGRRKAIVIAPQNTWGHSIATAFKQQWQQQGGKVVAELTYNKKQNLNRAIRNVLNYQENRSRARQLKRIIGDTFKTSPRRRQDADMIFLIALPSKARQIKPLLSFYFAGNIPVYATSSIYAGVNAPRHDRDLNGIEFSDMPWVFNQSPKWRNYKHHIAQLWPKDVTRYTRLYALGIDAFRLTQDLNQLQQYPHFGLAGVTGRLTLGHNGQIIRKLQWAQFKNGKAIPVS